jgi:hypothetical protein
MVLITGTITAIYPSFIIGVQAQGDPYHQMYNKYNSYEKQPREYPPKYADDREYNSYKPSYEKNGYDTPPSYENDNYQPREYYSSYQQDYKQEYPKYVKDNRDKPKKDSVSINKFNCINTNLNINGNNTGDINLGNKGTAEGGYVGGYSSDDGSGYNGNAGYYYGNGYDNSKQGKGFECIINNNNTNTNIVTGGGGNITDGNGNEPETTCEECFAQVLNITELDRLQVALGNGINITITIGTPEIEINSLGELCDVLENLTGAQVVSVVTQILAAVGIILTPAEFNELVTCIGTALGITIPRTLAASNTNTATSAFDINTAGGQASSFSSPPTIAQGTEDDLSALEKITKLKQQWLELLP